MPRDREILRVAERLFYERGYGAVPVDLIGAEVGVTGPAIYSHFRGKADILAMGIEPGRDQDELRAIRAGVTPRSFSPSRTISPV